MSIFAKNCAGNDKNIILLLSRTVEMVPEPSQGDIYVQGQPRMAKTSSRMRMEPQRMTIATEEINIPHRRSSHLAEARYHDTEF